MAEVKRSSFIAKGAIIRGNVTIGEDCGIWYNAVVRGDNSYIKIGDKSNVQDNCTIHCDPDSPVELGEGVVVGHNAVLHGCKVGNYTVIGMGAIVLNDAEIGEGCIIGAGAVVTQRTKIPPFSLVLGCPAKVVRMVTEEELLNNKASVEHYVRAAHREKINENMKSRGEIKFI